MNKIWIIVIIVVILLLIIFLVMKKKSNQSSYSTYSQQQVQSTNTGKLNLGDLGTFIGGAIGGYKTAKDETAAKQNTSATNSNGSASAGSV
jgi:hypothetical protein